MKILYITTIGVTMVFFRSFIRKLLDEGHEVDIATNETDYKIPDCYREWYCKVHHIDTSRSPFSKGNLTAIQQIKKLVEKNHYDIVHCHTPVAAMCTRLACREARKKGTKVFYTAHGFHFFKGAPLKNWLLYYPVEWICVHFTDVLITINQEDYALAKKRMKAKQVVYVPGVGIDVEKFQNVSVDKVQKRKELGIPENAFLLFSVGELNENKNHQVVIRAMAKLEDLNIHYAIAGIGEKREYLLNLAKTLGVLERVHLLGYRKDIADLYKTSDLFVFPSFREGLSASLMEAMASGLPCIASCIRGNIDLIDKSGGALFDPYRVDECCQAIMDVLNRDMERMRRVNKERVKNYSIGSIMAIMQSIYDI